MNNVAIIAGNPRLYLNETTQTVTFQKDIEGFKAALQKAQEIQQSQHLNITRILTPIDHRTDFHEALEPSLTRTKKDRATITELLKEHKDEYMQLCAKYEIDASVIRLLPEWKSRTTLHQLLKKRVDEERKRFQDLCFKKDVKQNNKIIPSCAGMYAHHFASAQKSKSGVTPDVILGFAGIKRVQCVDEIYEGTRIAKRELGVSADIKYFVINMKPEKEFQCVKALSLNNG